MTEPVRIAMWSGPRNISTAMMRSFGARPDTAVVDEPFYAAYLSNTGILHPMTEEVLASQANDWRDVVATLLGSVPHGKPIFYQKHMTHHMIPLIGREWLREMRNVFLIRDPVAVLASYVKKRSEATLEDIGISQQKDLFDAEADRLGRAPVVIDGADVLAAPAQRLSQLCSAIGISYTDAMLSWPAGRRDTDGVWAPAWYDAVERSTGFEAPRPSAQISLTADLQRIADVALPIYQEMARYRLV